MSTLMNPVMLDPLSANEGDVITLVSGVWVAAVPSGGFPLGYTASGTAAGGDLLVEIGDFDDANDGVKIEVDDGAGTVSFSFENAVRHTMSIDETTFEGALAIKEEGGFKGLITSALLTAQRDYAFPDKSGTFAMISDINGNPTQSFIIFISGTGTDAVTGVSEAYWDAPYDFTITEIIGTAGVAPTGSAAEIDALEGGVSILSTVISIDAGETSSLTAATPPVISDSSLAKGNRITFEIDQIGSTIAGQAYSVQIIGFKTV